MAKKNLSKSQPAAPQKAESEPHLFFLRIPADHPAYDPNPTLHLGLAAGHLAHQIANLRTVEQLAAIDQENHTIHAMSYGITAVVEKLESIHEHFREVLGLIEPASAGEGGAHV